MPRVYVLETLRPAGYYVGVTSDLSARLSKHRSGRGSTATRRFGCGALVTAVRVDNEKQAKELERKLVKVYRDAGLPAWGGPYTQTIGKLAYTS